VNLELFVSLLIINMKNFKKINFPQKSIFGYSVLSSFHSTISAYVIIISTFLLNPYFGKSDKEFIAGLLFNMISYLSIIILIINLYIKKRELKRKIFFFLNTPLLFFFPLSVYLLIKNILRLLIFLLK
jgi:hypothetical protein